MPCQVEPDQNSLSDRWQKACYYNSHSAVSCQNKDYCSKICVRQRKSVCVRVCGGICQSSQSQWLCKVLYCASAPVVNCSSVLTWFVTNCLKRVFTVCCLQVALNLSLNSPSLQLFLSLFRFHSRLISSYFSLSSTEMMHLSICVSSVIQLLLLSLISPCLWQRTKPLPGDTCQAHGNACNNSSDGNHNNNSQRHI